MTSKPLAVLVFCLGCAASLGPARALCYANADAAAQERVDVECRGLPFAECPFADDILEQLQRDQEACP